MLTRRLRPSRNWLLVSCFIFLPVALFAVASGQNTIGAGNILSTQYQFNISGNLLLLTIVIVAATGMFFMYYFKAASLRRKWFLRETIEAERQRITADLHDEIGSTLSSLQLYSQVAFKLIEKDSEKTKKILNQILQNSTKISEDISDIIWSLKTNDEHIVSIAGRIKNHVHNVLSHTDIDHEVYVVEDLLDSHNAVLYRKNILSIIKEALSNIVKYANAGKIKIWLYTDQNDYNLLIHDNGKGFDPRQAAGKGNGLENMKRRAEELNGSFEISSDVNCGSRISCKFPIKNTTKKPLPKFKFYAN